MSDHTWVQGDGIQIDVTVNETHSIDQRGIHNTVFLPNAVEDPKTGIQTRTDGTITIGQGVCCAVIFQRQQALIKLLHCLLDGVELSNGKGGGIYQAIGIIRGKHNSDIFVRPSDLFWRFGSNEHWADFPLLLQKLFQLKRRIAWQLAWALVRAAYAERLCVIKHLLDFARAGNPTILPKTLTEENVPAVSPATMFEAALAVYINDLKKQVLP